jgi:hypothetical protein
MIKPLLFGLGLSLLAANTFAVTATVPAPALQTTPVSLAAVAKDAMLVATIDEDRAMAELLKG